MGACRPGTHVNEPEGKGTVGVDGLGLGSVGRSRAPVIGIAAEGRVLVGPVDEDSVVPVVVRTGPVRG